MNAIPLNGVASATHAQWAEDERTERGPRPQQQLRDVLIVSPRFPPTNAADMHRVRLSLPFYRQYGWNPVVLTVADASVTGEDDPLLIDSIPGDIEVIRVPIWREDLCRRFGFGQLDYRAFVPMLAAGSDIIRRRKIPVAFFSTTAFLLFGLGPIWKRRHGCRIVYDVQDPWWQGPVSPYTRDNSPGSWTKYRIGQSVARIMEPRAMAAADHVLCTSDGYVRMLRDRYPVIEPSQFTVQPFPAAEGDFELVKRRNVSHRVFGRDGRRHMVYAGRGGPDMVKALSILFRELALMKQDEPRLAERMKVHFVGTNYAPAGRTFKVVEPLARKFGVEDVVEEISERLPYFEVLAAYRDADAVLVVGSDSSDYTASKLFNCVLSQKPILAIFHRSSLVNRVASGLSGVFLCEFGDGDEAVAGVRGGIDWALSVGPVRTPDQLVRGFLAESATEAQCAVFDRVAAL